MPSTRSASTRSACSPASREGEVTPSGGCSATAPRVLQRLQRSTGDEFQHGAKMPPRIPTPAVRPAETAHYSRRKHRVRRHLAVRLIIQIDQTEQAPGGVRLRPSIDARNL